MQDNDQEITILAFPGSLRARSLNRAALVAAQTMAPAGVTIELATLEGIPLYNGDIDKDGGPDPVRAFKERVTAADGLLIATPEYNYSIPGVLKNAIDWASRPAYKSPLAGKPVAMFGAAGGFVGGARALSHLKQVMLGVAAEVFPYPDVLLGSAYKLFDKDDLSLTDDDTRRRLEKLLVAYAAWLRSRGPKA